MPLCYLQLGAVGVALLGFAWLVLWLQRGWQRRTLQRRFRRGLEGQKAARRFLEERGYTIVAAEQTAGAQMEVDGERFAYDIRLDFIVRHRGQLLGVEVKTGQAAVDPLYPATRRQLLEYSHVFPLDGLYLLDMEARQLHHIAFPRQAAQTLRLGWIWPLVIGFSLGLAVITLLRS